MEQNIGERYRCISYGHQGNISAWKESSKVYEVIHVICMSVIVKMIHFDDGPLINIHTAHSLQTVKSIFNLNLFY